MDVLNKSDLERVIGQETKFLNTALSNSNRRYGVAICLPEKLPRPEDGSSTHKSIDTYVAGTTVLYSSGKPIIYDMPSVKAQVHLHENESGITGGRLYTYDRKDFVPINAQEGAMLDLYAKQLNLEKKWFVDVKMDVDLKKLSLEVIEIYRRYLDNPDDLKVKEDAGLLYNKYLNISSLLDSNLMLAFNRLVDIAFETNVDFSIEEVKNILDSLTWFFFF